MTRKFQNKYRIPSARLQAWDNSSEGLYVITINVVHHEYLFGTIADKGNVFIGIWSNCRH